MKEIDISHLVSSSMRCNVCGNEENIVGVASSSFVAMSLCYCSECLQKPADAEMIFDYLYYMVADQNPEKLDPTIKLWFTFINGEYVSWEDYCKLQRDNPKREYLEGIANAGLSNGILDKEV